MPHRLFQTLPILRGNVLRSGVPLCLHAPASEEEHREPGIPERLDSGSVPDTAATPCIPRRVRVSRAVATSALAGGVAVFSTACLLTMDASPCESDGDCTEPNVCAAGVCTSDSGTDAQADVQGDAQTDTDTVSTDDVADVAGDAAEGDTDAAGDSSEDATDTRDADQIDTETGPPDAEPDASSPCDGVNCGDHGECEDGACVCDIGYTGATCGACAPTFDGFPQCACPTAQDPVATEEGDGEPFICRALPDIVLYDGTTSRWTLLTNQGDGTFGDATTIGVRGRGNPRAFGVADFDADGWDDLWLQYRTVTGSGDSEYDWEAFQNRGDADIATSRLIETTWFGGLSFGMVGDLTGDGLADLTSLNYVANSWIYGINQGDLTFETFPSRTAYASSENLPILGDFDGDGFDDAGHFGAGVLVVYRFNPFNPFAPTRDFDFNVGFYPVPADFDGDGLDDILVHSAGTASIFYNLGEGRFSPASAIELDIPDGTVYADVRAGNMATRSPVGSR